VYTVSTLLNGDYASAEFKYDAPDVLPHGALFDRIVSTDPNGDSFIIDAKVTFHGSHVPAAQAHVIRTSFAESSMTVPLALQNGYGFWDTHDHRIAMVAWAARDIISHSSELHPGNYIVSLTFARNGWRRSVYALHEAATV